MYPELFQIGSFPVHSYGFLIVIGFLICVYLIRRKATAEGFNAEHFTDIAFWSLVAGLFGGRVLYIITRWDEFAKNPIEMFRFWEGGLVFYGGFIGGVTAFILLTKKFNVPMLRALDIATPSLAIAHSFGRLGCFAAGCCYGKPLDASHPFSVVFNHAKTIAPQGVHLHATQLYDSFNAFVLFLILQWVYKKKKFNGQVILTWAMLYAVGRSIVEIYRGDKIRGFVIGNWLSTSQFIAAIMFIMAGLVYFYLRKKSLETEEK